MGTLGGLKTPSDLQDIVIRILGKQGGQGKFFQALGICVTAAAGACENALNLGELTEICNLAVRTAWNWDPTPWSDALSATWLYMEREREFSDFNQETKACLEAISASRRAYIDSNMMEYDAERALEVEGVRWDFNDLFRYCAKNLLVRTALPPFPWRHDIDEARDVVERLKELRVDAVPAPPSARLLKCYFVCNGLSRL